MCIHWLISMLNAILDTHKIDIHGTFRSIMYVYNDDLDRQKELLIQLVFSFSKKKKHNEEQILLHSSILFFLYINNTVSINGNNWYQFVKHQFHSPHLLYRISDDLQFQCGVYLVIVWCDVIYFIIQPIPNA